LTLLSYPVLTAAHQQGDENRFVVTRFSAAQTALKRLTQTQVVTPFNVWNDVETPWQGVSTGFICE